MSKTNIGLRMATVGFLAFASAGCVNLSGGRLRASAVSTSVATIEKGKREKFVSSVEEIVCHGLTEKENNGFLDEVIKKALVEKKALFIKDMDVTMTGADGGAEAGPMGGCIVLKGKAYNIEDVPAIMKPVEEKPKKKNHK